MHMQQRGMDETSSSVKKRLYKKERQRDGDSWRRVGCKAEGVILSGSTDWQRGGL